MTRVPLRSMIALSLVLSVLAIKPLEANEPGEALALAIREGDLAEVERLITAGLDPDEPFPSSVTSTPRLPLPYAIRYRQVEVAELLLDLGADPDGMKGEFYHPLYWAAGEELPSIADRLVELGAQIPYCRGSRATESLVAGRRWKALERLTYFSERAPDKYSCTDLLFATLPLKDLALVRELVDLGADVTARGKLGLDRDGRERTPLEYALEVHHLDLARFLVERGADLNGPGRGGPTHLMETIDRDRGEQAVRSVSLLLELGAEPDLLDRSGCTALSRACDRKNVDIIQRLVDAGADPNRFLPKCPSSSCVGSLVVGRPLPDVIRAYFAAGGALNGSRDGAVPLVEAAREGNTEIAQMLLDLGAEVEVQDANGVTPLMGAAAAHDLELVEMFLARGARVSPADSSGKTALHHAADPEYKRCGPQDEEVTTALLRAGARINARDHEGRTPLAVAASHCGPMSTVLLAAGADPNIEDEAGRTPLHAIASREGIRTVRSYLAARANPDVRDVRGVTPTMLAAERLRQDIVEALREAGASSRAVDQDGETASEKFWTSELRGKEPWKITAPELEIDFELPAGFAEFQAKGAGSERTRAFYQLDRIMNSAPFRVFVARLPDDDYLTALASNFGLTYPGQIDYQPLENVEVSTIPGSWRTGNRPMIRAVFSRHLDRYVTYGVKLEEPLFGDALVAVAGSLSSAEPETVALLEYVLRSATLGGKKNFVTPDEPLEAIQSSAMSSFPLGVWALALALVLVVAALLVLRRRSRPRFYVPDHMRPSNHSRAADRERHR